MLTGLLLVLTVALLPAFVKLIAEVLERIEGRADHEIHSTPTRARY